MFKLEGSRIFVDFICRHSMLISSLVALVCLPQPQPVSARSVTSLCLLEQKRLLNITEDVRKRQEDEIIGTIDIICGGYVDYITCFTINLPNSHEIGDKFSRLMYQPNSMFAAYKGLCTKDAKALRRMKACLIMTPELNVCYKKYEKGVNKVIELQDQGLFTTGDLESLACNVSVGRYKCEIETYGHCNRKAGEIMKDFFYASLSDKCRTKMGLTSRYTQNQLNDHIIGEDGGGTFQQRGSENSASLRSFGVVNKVVKTFLDFILDTVAFSVRQFN